MIYYSEIGNPFDFVAYYPYVDIKSINILIEHLFFFSMSSKKNFPSIYPQTIIVIFPKKYNTNNLYFSSPWWRWRADVHFGDLRALPSPSVRKNFFFFFFFFVARTLYHLYLLFDGGDWSIRLRMIREVQSWPKKRRKKGEKFLCVLKEMKTNVWDISESRNRQKTFFFFLHLFPAVALHFNLH